MEGACQSVRDAVTDSSLHHLIATHQDVAWPDVKEVDATVGTFALTPSLVASLVGNTSALRELVDRGADLMHQDWRGWTVAHHLAARGDPPTLEYCVAQCEGLRDCMNHCGGTPADITSLLSPVDYSDQECFQYWDNATESISTGTGTQFNGLTGAIYTSSVVATRDALYTHWMTQGPSGGKHATIEAERYDAYRAYRATGGLEPLYLAVPQADDGGRKVGEGNPMVGHGTMAARDITVGDVLGEYCGAWAVERPGSGRPYHLEPVDGGDVRGMAAMVNDGPPNCAAVTLHNCRGMPRRIMFVATEFIPQHAHVMLNYGPRHSVRDKDFRYLLLRPVAIQTEMEGTTLEQYREMLRQAQPQLLAGTGLTASASLNYIFWLMCSPVTILYLVLRGVFALRDWMEFAAPFRQAFNYPFSPPFIQFVDSWVTLCTSPALVAPSDDSVPISTNAERPLLHIVRGWTDPYLPSDLPYASVLGERTMAKLQAFRGMFATSLLHSSQEDMCKRYPQLEHAVVSALLDVIVPIVHSDTPQRLLAPVTLKTNLTLLDLVLTVSPVCEGLVLRALEREFRAKHPHGEWSHSSPEDVPAP